MYAAVLCQPFKIDIYAVQPQLQRGIYDILHQCLAFRSGGEHLISTDIRPRLIPVVEIIPDTPDLQPVAMGLLHILGARKGTIIPLIVRNAEPGGRNHIHTRSFRRHLCQRGISALSADAVETQAHLPRHGDGCIFRRHIIVHRKDNSIEAAHNRQFSYKLYICLGGFCVNKLKINIQAVQVKLNGLCNQIVHKLLA